MKLALELHWTDTLGRSTKNFWRRWNLNCVLKDGDASYFSDKGRVMGEGAERVLEEDSDMNSNTGNKKAMAHLEVWLEHGLPRKTVLRNAWRTLNAMLISLQFILTATGSHWSILSRAVTRFYSYLTHFNGRGEKRLEGS